jgi:hypothetical protein
MTFICPGLGYSKTGCTLRGGKGSSPGIYHGHGYDRFPTQERSKPGLMREFPPSPNSGPKQ